MRFVTTLTQCVIKNSALILYPFIKYKFSNTNTFSYLLKQKSIKETGKILGRNKSTISR